MKVTKLDTQVAEQIGHAFGYYDYGEEVGMGAFYRSKDAVATYISGYVRMAFEGGMLYGRFLQKISIIMHLGIHFMHVSCLYVDNEINSR